MSMLMSVSKSCFCGSVPNHPMHLVYYGILEESVAEWMHISFLCVSIVRLTSVYIWHYADGVDRGNHACFSRVRDSPLGRCPWRDCTRCHQGSLPGATRYVCETGLWVLKYPKIFAKIECFVVGIIALLWPETHARNWPNAREHCGIERCHHAMVRRPSRG